jgi:hypothetical protein
MGAVGVLVLDFVGLVVLKSFAALEGFAALALTALGLAGVNGINRSI